LGKITKKLRIGLVLSAVPGYSETFFRSKIKFLQEEGVDIKLFVDQGQKEFDLCRVVEGFSNQGTKQQRLVKLLILVSRCLWSPLKLAKLWQLNKRDGFALKENLLSLISSVHILGHSLDWLHFGFATISVNRENVARVIGAKMAVSIRGYDINVYPLKYPRAYSHLWNRINKLHYIGDGLLRRAIEIGFDVNLPHKKITPAVNVELFANFKVVHRSTESEKYNSKINFLTVARLNWIKGLDYTLEALKIIKDAGVIFEYQIIGDGQEYERLVFARHQLGLQNEVVFIGKLDPNEIKEKLAMTDLYLQYSIQEGFCNAVIEAQAMGCLCVVSDAEGLSENVIDKITGFIVEKRNPKLLAETILNVLLMSVQDKKRISKQAMDRVSKEFNLDIQKQQFIEFYNQINNDTLV
jgi:colanic acid/amylovoran biosynthesis glycosyltransferase